MLILLLCCCVSRPFLKLVIICWIDMMNLKPETCTTHHTPHDTLIHNWNRPTTHIPNTSHSPNRQIKNKKHGGTSMGLSDPLGSLGTCKCYFPKITLFKFFQGGPFLQPLPGDWVIRSFSSISRYPFLLTMISFCIHVTAPQPGPLTRCF